MQTAIARAPKADTDLSMQLVFLVSVVNGIFEELFVAGYIITALTAAARDVDRDQRERRACGCCTTCIRGRSAC